MVWRVRGSAPTMRRMAPPMLVICSTASPLLLRVTLFPALVLVRLWWLFRAVCDPGAFRYLGTEVDGDSQFCGCSSIVASVYCDTRRSLDAIRNSIRGFFLLLGRRSSNYRPDRHRIRSERLGIIYHRDRRRRRRDLRWGCGS